MESNFLPTKWLNPLLEKKISSKETMQSLTRKIFSLLEVEQSLTRKNIFFTRS
jgi:hypothetical protein